MNVIHVLALVMEFRRVHVRFDGRAEAVAECGTGVC